MSLWKPVCLVDDIPVLGARRVARSCGTAVAVFRNTEDKVFALLDRCPHKGGPLSQGIVHGRTVTCPLHSWTIDLATGHPTGADAGQGCTLTAPLEVRDGRILLGSARR